MSGTLHVPVTIVTLLCIALNIHPAIARIQRVPSQYALIQTAIDSSVDNDTVLIAPGIYVERINLSGKNLVVGSLMLTTGDDDYIRQTVIDGDSLGSVVTIPAGSDNRTRLSGLTIQGGGQTRDGGGINCAGSSPILEYLIIQRCSASTNGGGIYVDQDSTIVRYSTLSENSSTRGSSGIWADGGTFTNLNFLNNRGTTFYNGGNVRVEDCYFEGNIGYDSPGTVIQSRSQGFFSRLVIQNNTCQAIGCSRDSSIFEDIFVFNNRGYPCGGAGFNSATTRLNRCVFGNNSSSDGRMGSALKFDSGSYITISNTTIVAGENPGADLIWLNAAVWPVFVNCIIDRNGSDLLAFWSHRASLTFAYCCFPDSERIQMGEGDSLEMLEGNIIASPGFVDRPTGDYRLREDSQCIDAGTSSFVWHGNQILDIPAEMYSGLRPDIGWFEYGWEPNQILHPESPPASPFLLQTYPNPFNSVTTIEFQQISSSPVGLNIYDLRGGFVLTLVNEPLASGTYQISWNAQGMPSGIYVIRLQSSGQTITRKVSLIR